MYYGKQPNDWPDDFLRSGRNEIINAEWNFRNSTSFDNEVSLANGGFIKVETISSDCDLNDLIEFTGTGSKNGCVKSYVYNNPSLNILNKPAVSMFSLTSKTISDYAANSCIVQTIESPEGEFSRYRNGGGMDLMV